MRALILAGGPGTRLLPHTTEVPKCLLAVHGKAVLDYQLETLAACGITDIAIVTGYLDHAIRAHIAGTPITIIHNAEYRSTNNAYAIWLARDFVLADPDGFVVINADLIFAPGHLRALLDAPQADGMIIDTNDDPTNDMVKMEMSADGRILAMSKTIPPERVAAEAVGPVKFSQAGGRQFIDLIGSYVAQGDLKRWFFYTIAEFAADHPFAGIKNPGFPWAEIDTPEDLAEASRKVPPPADIHDTP